MVEPQAACVESLKHAYEDKGNVELHAVAVGYKLGQTYLYVPEYDEENPDAGASAYIDRDGSPHQTRTGDNVEDGHSERVEVITFDMIDDGTIDALHIDTEGHEWAVIKHMISRPKVISIEMYGPQGYVNPHKQEIEDWLKDNQYKLHSTCQVEYPEKGIWIDTDVIYTKES